MTSFDDLEKQVKLWPFIFTSFADHDADRLSNLDTNIFVCVFFAVVDNLTANRHLQGFVRTHNRCHKRVLRRFIGDNVTCDTPETKDDVHYILTVTQLSLNAKEFASVTKSRFEGYFKEIKEFKTAINNGLTTLNKLTKRHPSISLCFPLLMLNCLDQVTKKWIHNVCLGEDAVHRTPRKKLAFHNNQLHRP